MFTMTLLLIYYLNFKYGNIAVARARGGGRTRGPRPGLLLPLELLGVGRVGRARPRVPLGDGGVPARAEKRRLGRESIDDAGAPQLAHRVADPARRAHPAGHQLEHGLARAATRTRATSRTTC